MSLAVSLNSEIRGQGFPILCLHGHPGSGGCMSVFTDHLSQNYQTIAPDLRGYGKSQVKQPFEMTDHLQDIEQLLDSLKIDKCLIIGWSLGGILALELALTNPERFTGLILVATSAYPRGNHPPISWLDNLLTGIAGIINWIWPASQWNINLFGKRSLFRYLIQQHTATAYKYIAKQATPAYLQTSRPATIALRQALKNRYNRLAELGNISCHCLILAGECDRHITAISSQETAANLPNSQFNCYPNTAHLFPWEIPDQVITDIDNWIKNHPDIVDIW
ncbi:MULTISPECIES: alpha/beta fold hydrolase [Limnospira]|nr:MULTISPECIES: alpha/beta hydrolase [Limnospira]MDY7052158.1 alpha/beta hydrolase [Limnospira fusiformis LS22]QNH55817.1 MAG: alpha/beta hydrolase [Limnospira indica BM01]